MLILANEALSEKVLSAGNPASGSIHWAQLATSNFARRWQNILVTFKSYGTKIMLEK